MGVACANPRTIGIERGCKWWTVTLSEPQGWRRWGSQEEVAVPTLLQKHFRKAEVVVSRLVEWKLGWHRLQNEWKTRTGKRE